MLESLQVFSDVPEGCRLVLVSNDNCEPLIHAGEFAIVDARRRSPVFGSVYAIDQSNGAAIWRLYDPAAIGICSSDVFYLGPPVSQTYAEVSDLVRHTRAGRRIICRVADGPICGSALRPKIVGEVIGIYRSDLDQLPSSRVA